MMHQEFDADSKILWAYAVVSDFGGCLWDGSLDGAISGWSILQSCSKLCLCNSFHGYFVELLLLDGLLQKERKHLPGGWTSSVMVGTACNANADCRTLQSLYSLIYNMLT
jgi:hypothetical protein